MSGGDAFDRAVHALRAMGDRTHPEPGRTRTRVLLAAMARGRAQRRVVRWVLPLAATLVFSSAWATSRGHLQGPWRAMRDVFRVQHPLALASAAPHASVAASSSAAAVGSAPHVVLAEAATPPVPAQAPPFVSIDDLPRVLPPPASPPPAESAAPAPAAPRANASADTAPADADGLYAAAHRAHFVDGDPAPALAAWDAYLRAAPNGRLAPEAHYNRALMLVRLERRAEASAALRPFAEGRYGSYRQREAAQIIAALDHGH